jgi:proteic killer suppression protein
MAVRYQWKALTPGPRFIKPRFDPFDVILYACYDARMITGFRGKDTEALANNRYVKKFDSIQVSARKRLAALQAARGLRDLAAIPGFRLEALHGDREGQFSIRINDQYRICFVPEGEDFNYVEITDYH